MINPIYIYEKVPKDLSENGIPLLDWADDPEITRSLNSEYSFYGNYSLVGKNKEYLKKGYYIKALVSNDSWQYFRIKSVDKNLHSVSIKALHLGYEANRNFIQMAYTANGTGNQIMENLKANLAFKQPFIYESNINSKHQFTAKEVNPISAIIGQNNGNENLTGVTSGELDMDNYRLILKDRIGEDNGFRIDLGVNLESIKETVDDLNVSNSLYLIGGTPEDINYNEDQEPITFAFLETKGVTDENRRITSRTNSECKTVEELKKWGQSLFDKERIHEPKVTHEINMVTLENTIEYQKLYGKIMKLNFGDTVYCDIEYNGITGVKERVTECTWFPTLGKYKNIVLGNEIKSYTDSVNTAVNQITKKLEVKSEDLQNAIVNATQWITGTKGGYVRFRPKDAPEEILIMDRPNANDAKKVWRWNLGGLGYSNSGVNGPFETAITQDGSIVANFITAGILTGILVQGVALKTLDDKDFQVVVEGGKVAFERKRVSTGLKDVHGELFGDIKATYDGSGKKANGFAVRQKHGYIFSINTISKNNEGQSVPIIQIPADVHPDNRKVNSYASWSHKGNFSVSNEVDISGILKGTIGKFDKLYVGGKEVIPGQNGGGGSGAGTGGYPSEVTSDADKFAWDLWSYLLANGYSKAAAAGILGNVQGEVGPSMNPDTEQIGGPAYGWVQWDGSAYPLVGAPTWNGREYVQRLIAAAGIKQDYRTSLAQAQLINWCMFNGQWLGQVSPLTVDEFKVVSSPKTAAYAFELNFERPAAAHPERQTYAQAWYDKFKDLKASTATGKAGIEHLETLMGKWLGNGQCYAVPAEYSGFMGGCGLGAGTIYGFSHVIGDTSSAADIGEAYDWNAVGWRVIQNPTYQDLVVGAIVNIRRGGQWGTGWTVDPTYGHTGVIYGLNNGRIQTIEQNAEQGQIVAKYDRLYFANSIQSIVIPPK
ncbi:TPA: CHAP domain-containing protein [Enterococcus faecalis]|nr:CHAP domain-containing protein [Enterococcus faecalis]HAP4330736.1 CHAP domain-containing protein [Enterococcus faecalis]